MNMLSTHALRCAALTLAFLLGGVALAAAVTIKAGGPALAVLSKEPSPTTTSQATSAPSPKDASAEPKTAEKPAPAQTFPGLAEVVPAATELARKSLEAREIITATLKITSLKTQVLQSEDRLRKLREQIEGVRDLGQLDASRLGDAKALLLKERKTLESLVASVSAKINEIEPVRTEWEKKRVYWQEWRQSLHAPQLELPTETFAKAQEQIESTLEAASIATVYLVSFQERLSHLMQETIAIYKPLEEATSKQRTEAMKRVDPSLFSPLFYAQFDAAMWASMWEGVVELWRMDDLLDTMCGMCLVARCVLVVLFWFLVMWLRATAANETKDESWSILLGHPFFSAVFLAWVFSAIVLPDPLGFWRLMTWGVFVAVEAALVTGMLRSSRARRCVCFLAAMAAAMCVAKAVSVPVPLYRVFSSLCSGAGAVFFLVWAKRSYVARKEGVGGRRFVLPGGLLAVALVMSVSFLAQSGGRANVADRLLFDFLGVVSLVIGAFLSLRFLEAGLTVTLERSAFARVRLFSHFGNEIAARVRFVLRIAICLLTVVGLLRFLGVYSTTGLAFEKFFAFSLTVGALVVTPGMIVAAMFVLFLANSLSWFLRAVLDAEVFPRKQMDPGASHAINKLLHYFVMMMGFLLVMSTLGLDMKSFTVLGGALGVGIGFGLKNFVDNFISGLILLFERPIKVGDRVMVDSDLGVVKRIGLRSTVIQTFDYAELIVPNSQFISAKVTNMTLSSTTARLKIPLGVAYGSDIPRVIALLQEAGAANPRVSKDPAPLALMLQFGASSLDFELQVWLPDIIDLALARSEICQDIARRFQEAGIEIPFPQCDVHLRQAANEQSG